MKTFPTIETPRLILNRPTENDLADLVNHLNSSPAFAENTLNIPYPYQEDNGRFWLKMADDGFQKEEAYVFGIRDRERLKLMGAIGLHLDKNHHKAELGYWIAMDYWNKGIATESGRAVINFGFKELNLNKIYASHFPHNPTSGRILEKIGMKQEAILKEEYFKNGKFLDVTRYAILKEDYF